MAKVELRKTKKQLNNLNTELVERLVQEQKELKEFESKNIVLDIFIENLKSQIVRYVTEKRLEIIAILGNLWDKYRISLSNIEESRNKSSTNLRRFLGELSYE